jgi:hypothetical protein
MDLLTKNYKAFFAKSDNTFGRMAIFLSANSLDVKNVVGENSLTESAK